MPRTPSSSMAERLYIDVNWAGMDHCQDEEKQTIAAQVKPRTGGGTPRQKRNNSKASGENQQKLVTSGGVGGRVPKKTRRLR